MKRRPHLQQPESETPTLTPGLAIWMTISASWLSLWVLSLLAGIYPGDPPYALLGLALLSGYGLVFALAKVFVEDPPGPALGFRPAPAHTWVAAALLIPSVLIWSELENVLSDYFPRAETSTPDREAESRTIDMLQVGLVQMAVVPLVLETFLRGLVQPRMEPFWGSKGSVFGVAVLTVVAAAPFALIAGRPTYLIVEFGLSLLLSIVRRTAGSIRPCLLLSVGYGLISTLADQEALGIEGFDKLEASGHTPLSVLAIPAMMMGIALALCRNSAPVRSASEDTDLADTR